jgi:hypothetical protein
LDQNVKIDSIDDDLVKERLKWVLLASSAKQLEYAVNFMNSEPKKNSFHMLHQIVLSLGDSQLFNLWQR